MERERDREIDTEIGGTMISNQLLVQSSQVKLNSVQIKFHFKASMPMISTAFPAAQPQLVFPTPDLTLITCLSCSLLCLNQWLASHS
jgi:hypothetical protein